MDWSPTVGPAFFVSLAALFVTVGTAIFLAIKGFGVRETEAKALAKRLDGLEADMAGVLHSRTEYREADRKEREVFQISVNAGLEMSRSNLSDFQRSAAERFATKNEMLALEDRTNKGMDRIVDRLEQISVRLESIGDTINKSLVTLVAQNRH